MLDQSWPDQSFLPIDEELSIALNKSRITGKDRDSLPKIYEILGGKYKFMNELANQC